MSLSFSKCLNYMMYLRVGGAKYKEGAIRNHRLGMKRFIVLVFRFCVNTIAKIPGLHTILSEFPLTTEPTLAFKQESVLCKINGKITAVYQRSNYSKLNVVTSGTMYILKVYNFQWFQHTFGLPEL